MTREEIFKQLTLYFAEQIYSNSEDTMKKAYITQNKNRDSLLNEIGKILLQYNIKNDKLSISYIQQQSILNQIGRLIQDNIQDEIRLEKGLIKRTLIEVGQAKHSTNNYILSLGTSFKVSHVTDKVLNEIINTKIDKKIWSDRLHDNKNEIYKILLSEVNNFLKGKTNINKIETVLRSRFDTNLYETRRLVQDNVCRVQESVNHEWQNAHGIKYTMYMSALDSHVCDKCKRFDGKVYLVDQKPVSIPQHPFDRCVYVSLPSADWKPKMRLDNETKQKINWTTFEEWQNNQES